MVLLSRLSWFMITLLKQKQKLPKSSKLLVRIEWIKFFCTWNVPKSGNFTPASIHQSLSLSGDSQKLASNTAMSHCLVNRLRQKAGCYQEFKKPPGNDLCNPKTVKSSAICKRYVNCEAFVLCVLNPDWPVIKNVYIYIYIQYVAEMNIIQYNFKCTIGLMNHQKKILVICSPAVLFFFVWKTASKRAVRSIGCKGHALKG